MAEYYLADLFLNRGRIEDAAPLFERVLSAQRRLYGEKSRATADTLASLAQVRIAQKNFGTAEKLIREALEAHRESGSAAFREIGYLQTMLANGAHATEQVRRRRADSSGHSRSLYQEYSRRSPIHCLCRALPGRGSYSHSISTVKQRSCCSLRLSIGNALARPVWRSARSGSALGEALQGQGRTDEAEQHLVDSYRELNADPGRRRRQQAHCARAGYKVLYVVGSAREVEHLAADGWRQLGARQTEQRKAPHIGERRIAHSVCSKRQELI